MVFGVGGVVSHLACEMFQMWVFVWHWGMVRACAGLVWLEWRRWWRRAALPRPGHPPLDGALGAVFAPPYVFDEGGVVRLTRSVVSACEGGFETRGYSIQEWGPR